MAPLLLVVGAVNVNAVASEAFEMVDVELRSGLLSTERVVEALPEAYVAVAGIDAVIVVDPPPTIVTRPVVALMVATAVLELV
jgi:hypothetical protein